MVAEERVPLRGCASVPHYASGLMQYRLRSHSPGWGLAYGGYWAPVQDAEVYPY